MIPRTIARITEKIGRELNSGAGPSEEALAAGPDIGRVHDRVALTVPIALWAGPSQDTAQPRLRPMRSGILGAN